MEALVHMIDGTGVWVPIPVQEVSPSEYAILESEHFDPEDTMCLMQFIPGDVVRLDQGRAAELLYSKHRDREYWRLLYAIVAGKAEQDEIPLADDLLRRISAEIASGTRRHYPAVVEWVRKHRLDP